MTGSTCLEVGTLCPRLQIIQSMTRRQIHGKSWHRCRGQRVVPRQLSLMGKCMWWVAEVETLILGMYISMTQSLIPGQPAHPLNRVAQQVPLCIAAAFMFLAASLRQRVKTWIAFFAWTWKEMCGSRSLPCPLPENL